jgi:EmrB/QacA subfamily drug resistance transporter
VTTALPSIQHSLHSSLSDLEWMLNAYTLTFTVLMIPSATIGDKLGHRLVLLSGVFLFILGSVSAALSSTALQLVLARALQGVGGACITPLTLTLLVRAFPSNQRATIIGLWSGVSGLGLAVGPLIGGALVNTWNWHAVFWVNLPVGVVVLVLGWLYLHESHSQPHSLDLLGSILIGGSLLGTVFALIRGSSLGWGSLPVLAAFTIGILLFAAFLLRERSIVDPMIDLALFQERRFSLANGVGFLMSFSMFGSIFLLTQFLQNVLGASPLSAGLETIAWTGAIMFAAPLAGAYTRRLGTRVLILAGMSIQTLALCWIGQQAQANIPYLHLLPAFLLGGTGMGIMFSPLSTMVINSVAVRQQGQASSIYNTVRELGGVFGIAVLGSIFQWIAPTSALFLQGFRISLYTAAGILAFGTVLASLFPRKVTDPQQLSSLEYPLEEVHP